MSRLAVLGVALALCGCTDDDGEVERGHGDHPSMTTFTAFVLDLIENQTADDTEPLDLEVFDSLDDPDTHRHDEGAYSRIFFE